MKTNRVLTLAPLALAAAILGHAAAGAIHCPGSLDPAFDASFRVLSPYGTDTYGIPFWIPTSRLVGTNLMLGGGLWGPDTFESITVQPDGKIILAGGFYEVQGVPRTAIARLEPDGSLDHGFAPTLTGGATTLQVRAVDLRPEGKILIGGSFTAVNGQSRPGLALLNGDGSLDPDFSVQGTNFVEIHAMAVLTDGKIVVSETHVIYHEDLPPETAHGLVRLLPNGQCDFGFAPTLPLQAPVISLLEQPGERVLLDGLVRLQGNGTVDPTYAPELPANYQVQSVLPQPDGKILIAGGAYPVLPADTRSIQSLAEVLIRLDADGARDTTFSAPDIAFPPEDDPNASLGLRALLLQADGKIVLGGLFKLVNDVGRSDVARLNADGTLDAGLAVDILVNPGFDHEEVETVTAMAMSPEGKLLLGGFFRTVNGQSRSDLVACYSGFDPRPYRIEPDTLVRTAQGHFHMRFQVPSNSQFSVQASVDLVDWTVLTNFSPGPITGVVDFEDAAAALFNRRFYRLGPPECDP